MQVIIFFANYKLIIKFVLHTTNRNVFILHQTKAPQKEEISIRIENDDPYKKFLLDLIEHWINGNGMVSYSYLFISQSGRDKHVFSIC